MKRIRIVLKSLVVAACGSSAALAAPPTQQVVSQYNASARVVAPQAEVATLGTRLDGAGMTPLPAPVMGSAPVAAYGSYGDCCPTECNGSDWLLEADWLYWKAHRNGLDFAFLDSATDDFLGAGDVARIGSDRDSGFRIGLFRQSSSGMDLGVRYTHFDTQSSGSLVDANPSVLTPGATGNSSATRVHPGAAFEVGDLNVAVATSEYDLEYRLIDVEAGYRLDVNCNSSVRPFAGLRFAHIDQQMESLYGADAVDFSGDVVAVLESVDMDSWGLFAGTEARFSPGASGLHVFGRGAVGLHHAEFDSQFTQFDVDADAFEVRATDGDRRIVASLEAQAGLGYDLYQGCRGGVDLQVGYDFQKWFNMADFIAFNDDVLATPTRNDASLGLDGWFVRVTITR